MRRRVEIGRVTGDQAGFSLIEVVVALFLLGIVATAALGFFIRGMQNTSHQQRSQAAVAVATQGMELARSVTPQAANGAGTSGLLIGRAKADVDAAWAAAAATDTAQMNADWDPAAANSANAVIPIVGNPIRVSDETFTVTTLIGTCFRPIAAAQTDKPCTKANPGGGAKLYRIVVVVKWAPTKAGQCGGATVCTYRVSALVDPSNDANWNLTAKPVAYDDALTVVAGSASVYSDILANDVMGAVTSNPTTIITLPTMGTVSVRASGATMGGVDFTAPADASGITQFTYTLKDQAGRTSNEAIATVTVTPKSVNDTGYSVLNVAKSFDVLANDLGTFTAGTTVSITAPVTGASVSGTNIVYNGAATGSKTIKYKVKDPWGGESAEATLVVTVKNSDPPVSSPQTITVAYSPKNAMTTNLDILNKTGNPSSFSIVMSGAAPSPGTVTLNGAANVATFNQPAGMAPGTYTVNFAVKNLDGEVTAATPYTIIVAPPVAVADAYSVKKSVNSTLIVGTNDTPLLADWSSRITVAVFQPAAGCGSVAVSPSDGLAGKVVYTAPAVASGTKACSFDYQLQQASGTAFVSNRVTVTLSVTQ
ncbi:Ig-like domain-containing protein [Cellulomonas sp.]|uniref:Ig-like domain-containing protein n=1 Tax=Cellulomonas sp. TaxID=40001 RepID=UPI003BA88840